MASSARRFVCSALLWLMSFGLWTALPAMAEPVVVATTSIVGDVVANVAGERVKLAVLVPIGADPHSYDPTPSDARRLHQADVVFSVGAGLEESLYPLLRAAEARVVHLADSVPLLSFVGGGHSSHADHPDDEGEHGPYDPHVWLDPTNVVLWTQVLEEVLCAVDPEGCPEYAVRAAAYREELHELDRWIEAQVDRLAPERRLLVADHHVFGYFAHRYGFEVVGAVIPALSTLAEPSARELAALTRAVRELGVPAVFVGTAANPVLADMVARETGTRVVRLYTASLSDSFGAAPTYIELMRYNVSSIVEALEGG